MVLEPSFDGNLIFYGEIGVNLDAFNLTKEEYLSIHSLLVDKYGLELKKVAFYGEKRTVRKIGEKANTILDIIPSLIRFEQKCYELDKNGFDITNIINTFNISQKDRGPDEFYHAYSLVQICKAYHDEDYDVKILSDRKGGGPDLIIEGIETEIKHRRAGDFTDFMLKELGIEEFEYGQVYKFQYSYSEALVVDLGNLIKNRIHKAAHQADQVFFDLSPSASLGQYQVSLKKKLTTSLPKPKRYRLILFSAMEGFWARSKTSSTYEQPPILWTYIDFDSLLWCLLGDRSFHVQANGSVIPQET